MLITAGSEDLLREMGPVGNLVERQVGRLQPRAAELVREGAPESALRKYEMATKICPEHPYAWHDIFSANSALAEHGQANIAQMRLALDEVTKLGQGQPGLSDADIAQLEKVLADVEAKAS
jgi:hypothetical protein